MLSEFLKFTEAGLLGICLVMLFLKWQEMKAADRADEQDDSEHGGQDPSGPSRCSHHPTPPSAPVHFLRECTNAR